MGISLFRFVLPTIDLNQHTRTKYHSLLGRQCSPRELEWFSPASGTYVSRYTVTVHYQVQELCKQILLTYLFLKLILLLQWMNVPGTFLGGHRFSTFLFGTIYMRYCIKGFESLSQNLMKGRKCFHSSCLM